MTKSSRVGSRSAGQSPGGVRGVDTSTWARVDPDALAPQQRAMFTRRRIAIKLYLEGALDADIRRERLRRRRRVAVLRGAAHERCLLERAQCRLRVGQHLRPGRERVEGGRWLPTPDAAERGQLHEPPQQG